jgi:pentatricopeptide repeat protein
LADAEPDTVLCNVALNACGRAKAWRQVLQLLEELHCYGVKPDIISDLPK